MQERAAAIVAAALVVIAARAASPSEAAPYGQVEVRFENDGLSLAGSLLLPPGRNLPAVAMIHGSGTSGRSNQWAFSIADALARCGIAVLIPDKRGSEKSQGDWKTADITDLAADAHAGWELLRGRPKIDSVRIGYVGLSQGGHVVPLAAATSPGAAFAINMVGSTQIMEAQLYDELELAYRKRGLDQATIDYLQEFARFSFDYIRTGAGWERYRERHREIATGPFARAAETWPTSPEDPYWTFWRGVYDFDPMPWWRRVVLQGIPALIVYGADDENVNVTASVARLGEQLPDGGVTLRVYPGIGHDLRDPATRQLQPEFVAETCEWLLATGRRARGPF
ncbi:MAG: alpha/beta hydrolase family protein [Steroidobacteraceae bacterium]